MKLFLFALFFAFSAQAQTTDFGVDVSDLLARYAPSALPRLNAPKSTSSGQVSSSKSEFCVQNNRGEGGCEALGYTETVCPNGGVACPFDKTKLSCTKWSCTDLGLFENRPDNMACEAVSVSGITCLKCFCDIGFINPEGCGGIVDTLVNDKSICSQLGYTQSVTDCANYITCPSDQNKVRCIDSTGCIETNCIARYEVPENAHGIKTPANCNCGGTKSITTDWVCDEGYSQEGSKQNGTCVEINCPEGEFADEDPLACLKDGAAGWQKTATTNTGKKQCYVCECNVPDAYKYTQADAGEYGQLETVACDDVHYKTCTKTCPTSVIPNFEQEAVREKYPGVEPEYTSCSACGETSQYMSGWHCNPEGWQINSTATACNPVDCPANHDGLYYRIDFDSIEDCTRYINNGAGWSFNPQGAKSGGDWCGLCQCPYGEDDALYKWSSADSGNTEDVELSGLGCNGKYKECTPKNNNYLSEIPEHATAYNTRKVCGEDYYQITKCETGYTLSNDDSECLPTTCDDDYIIIGDCPEWGECRGCNSGGVEKRKLISCRGDNINMIEYAISPDKTTCCQKTCDPNDTAFFIGDTCPEGKTLLEENIKQNGCGDTCIKCI